MLRRNDDSRERPALLFTGVNMREIVCDTETTGLNPAIDRIVSLALIELVDAAPTGQYKHYYVNPQRESSPGALKVHGLTAEFLRDKPLFSDIAGSVLDFIGGARLVIHNAQFDAAFLREEFARARPRAPGILTTLCTLDRARQLYGQKPAIGGNKLDHLVARYGIRDLRAETGNHGALIDALLLVNVYRGLLGLPVLDLHLPTFGLNDGPQTSAATASKPVAEETQRPDTAGSAGNVGGVSPGIEHQPSGRVAVPAAPASRSAR